MIRFIFKFICFLFPVTVGSSYLFAVPDEPLETPKILVIEDSNQIRRLLVEILIEENYNVREANNTERGLNLWTSFKPDIVITDMNMPLKEGEPERRTAGLKLIKNAPQDKAKIILSSGYSSSSPTILKAEPMVDVILGKPFSVIDSLLPIIKDLLESQDPPARTLVRLSDKTDKTDKTSSKEGPLRSMLKNLWSRKASNNCGRFFQKN